VSKYSHYRRDSFVTDLLNADQRWAAAANLAAKVEHKVPRHPRLHAMRHNLLTRAPLLLGVLLAFWLVPTRDGNVYSAGGTQQLFLIVTLTLVVCGVIFCVVGYRWARRTGRLIDRSQSVIGPLSEAEADKVRRQLRGREPVDEARLPILLAVARQNSNFSQGLEPIFSGVILFIGAIAMATGFALPGLIVAGLAAVVFLSVSLRIDHRAPSEKFLRDHPVEIYPAH
jgi:hypothetical protein